MNIDIPINATEDLSGGQYKVIDIDGTFAAAALIAIGPQQGKAKSGEDATARTIGISRFWAGGAITQGARMTVTTSGFCIAAVSGSPLVGRAITTVVSGELSEGLFNLVTPGTMIT